MSENEFEASDFEILMVDDLPKNLQILGNILKNENYKIEFATSGDSALKWLKKKKFDLILLDVMMPEMSGFDVCQHIRQNENYHDMPIIFLTAKADKESLVNGFELGGQDYVTKPFDSSELLVRVKTHLELKRSKEKLKDINLWLEKEVKRRTEQLRKANEELTKLNEKLSSLNQQLLSLDAEKTEFLQIISHEIRTPLNAIKGFLGLAKEKTKEEKILSYFNYIDEASFKLEKFSLQALLYTELRTGKYPVKKTEIKIKETLEQIIATEFIQLLDEKKIKTSYDISPENIKVNADRQLFTTCVTNIFENAINFSSPKSEIKLKAFFSDHDCIIEFHDNGSGFSNKALLNLDKMFASGSEGLSQGKGIGLAMASLIMTNHGGKLAVINKAVGGANVTLLFPK